MRLLRERQPLSRLTPTGAVKKQQKFFHNPSVSFADSIPQFAMVAPLRSQVRLRLSRLSVQHGRSASSHRPALTLARCSVAAHCALLRVLATPALRASDVRKLTRGAPCFTGLIDGYCSHWLRRLFRPHWAYFALLRAQRARFVRPLGLKGSLLDSATTAGSCPAKSLLFPEGKREVARRKP